MSATDYEPRPGSMEVVTIAGRWWDSEVAPTLRNAGTPAPVITWCRARYLSALLDPDAEYQRFVGRRPFAETNV